jgi:hypothetical protein
MRSAGSTVNDIADRKFDGHVERTRFRPLASGQIGIPQAFVFLAVQLTLAASLLFFLTPYTRLIAICVCRSYSSIRSASASPTGNGYAAESARSALDHAIKDVGLREIVSYTGPDNLRSQAVMKRLDLIRRPSLDFVIPLHKGGEWHGLVWVVAPEILLLGSTSFL